MERRKMERRSFATASPFPFWTAEGWVIDDRRSRPDRRLNNIKLTVLVPQDNSGEKP
jgi:hypothetical protein